MTRFDLHPEELIDRARRGITTEAESARLAQHLGECEVCRVERALWAQAERDAAPLRDERLLVARLKRDVMARFAAPIEQRPRRQRALVIVALAASGLASVATAATLVLVRPDPAPIVVAPPGPPPQTSGAEGGAELAPELAPPAPPPRAELIPEPAPEPPRAAAVEPASASELFSRANQARREGKVKDAVRLYRALQDRFAGTSEELVSRVTLGRLLLDRLGDSRGALVQFNSYLASPAGGALREEAMVGRALALGRLGRSAEERAAWKALLDAWPKSTHQKRARARLAELGGRALPAASSPVPGSRSE